MSARSARARAISRIVHWYRILVCVRTLNNISNGSDKGDDGDGSVLAVLAAECTSIYTYIHSTTLKMRIEYVVVIFLFGNDQLRWLIAISVIYFGFAIIATRARARVRVRLPTFSTSQYHE